MKAFVTGIGESTTDLCIWSLERQGFKVHLIENKDSSLRDKLSIIYNSTNEDFLRVDADVIVNKNVKKLVNNSNTMCWWFQAKTFDWFKQDWTWGGVQFIRRPAISALKDNIDNVVGDRPETTMYRLPAFHDPRRCGTVDLICGIHGYKQNDVERVIEVKANRNYFDDFDFELAMRLDEL